MIFVLYVLFSIAAGSFRPRDIWCGMKRTPGIYVLLFVLTATYYAVVYYLT